MASGTRLFISKYCRSMGVTRGSGVLTRASILHAYASDTPRATPHDRSRARHRRARRRRWRCSAAARLFEEPLPDGPPRLRGSAPRDRAAASRAARTRLADCDRIAVCAGPGSFTGVRVGLATAWGLGRALGIAVEAVSTLEAMAEAARGLGTRRASSRFWTPAAARSSRERFDLDGAARALARTAARCSGRRRVRDSRGAASRSSRSRRCSPERRPPRCPRARGGPGARRRRVRRRGSALRRAIYSRPSAAEEKHGAS